MSNHTFLRIQLVVAMTAGALLVTACGGGTNIASNVGSGGTGFVSGVVTKGPLGNASVTAYSISGGQMGTTIGSTMTDTNGNFSMGIGSYAGPVMLQVSGGVYKDEATGTTMSMAQGDVMTAIMPTVAANTNTAGIQVTPVTGMAQTLAQSMPGGMTDANIASANASMGNYFSISDVLHVAPMNPLVPGSGTGASQDARNYGMTLAAVSQYAKNLNMAVSSAMVTALMNDASDGMMEGKKGSAPVSMTMGGMMGTSAMASNAGTGGLASAMTTFANSAGNMSGVTATDMSGLTQKLNTSNGRF
ncbi:MAG: hypothetical protein Q7T07_00430 [Burkholderiaceae bacterium]|nr:hypothetical protein [Burkholderiaceae bacterium]